MDLKNAVFFEAEVSIWYDDGSERSMVCRGFPGEEITIDCGDLVLFLRDGMIHRCWWRDFFGRKDMMCTLDLKAYCTIVVRKVVVFAGNSLRTMEANILLYP